MACHDKSSNSQSEKKVWVYFNIGEKDDPSSYGVYGEISQKDLDFIKLNSTSKKLISVEKIRFIDNDSIIKDVSIDSNEKGVEFYQIKEINYLEVLKKDPLNTKTDYYIE